MPIFSNFSSSSAQGYGELRNINKTWTDNFQRSTTVSGLGNSFNGQPWTATRGNWYINASGQAQTNDSNYSIVSTYMGSPNTTSLTVSGISNGAGVTFWQVDANNWWAASLTAISSGYNYSYSTTVTGCSYAGGGTNTYTGSTYNTTPYSNSCGTYTTTQSNAYACAGYCGVDPQNTTCSNGSCTPYSTTSSCSYTLCPGDPGGCTGKCVKVGSFQCSNGSYANAYNCTTTVTGCTPNTNCCANGSSGPCSPVYCSSCCTCYSTTTVYGTYCFDNSGVQSNATSTSSYPACPTGYFNNVCGPICTPTTFPSTASGVGTGSYYQFQILQSIGGVVSVISGTNLITGTVTVIASGNTSLSYTLPQAINLVASGGIVTASIFTNSNITSSPLATLIVSGTGTFGESVGMIKVPSGTIASSTIISSFYSQL